MCYGPGGSIAEFRTIVGAKDLRDSKFLEDVFREAFGDRLGIFVSMSG